MLSVEKINMLESENNMLRDSLSLSNSIVNKYHAIIQEIKDIAKDMYDDYSKRWDDNITEGLEQILQVIDEMDGDSNGNI